jgi:hypothetical protein
MPLKNLLLRDLNQYPLPSFLQGKCEHAVYCKWLRNKADTLLKRDKRRGKPYALAVTKAVYKDAIHRAVIKCDGRDPYTGEALAWEIIGVWDTTHDQPDGYKKKFALLPTVDHVCSDKLEFEICALQTNEAKADLSPEEFVELCKKVTKYQSS